MLDTPQAVLSDFKLEVPAGKVTALCGLSGAGEWQAIEQVQYDFIAKSDFSLTLFIVHPLSGGWVIRCSPGSDRGCAPPEALRSYN